MNHTERLQIDSLQRLDHREHSSMVPRDEIILNPRYLAEEETMAEAREGAVKCGVHPHLMACHAEPGATPTMLGLASC